MKASPLRNVQHYLPAKPNTNFLVASAVSSFFMIQKIEDFGIQALFFVLWYSVLGLMIFKPKFGRALKTIRVFAYSAIASFAIALPSFAGDGAGGDTCTNMGFLNPIGTFAITAFDGITGNDGSSISGQFCRIIVIGLLSFLALAVFAIIMAAGRMSQNQDMSAMFYSLVPWIFAILAIGVVFALAIGGVGGGPAEE